MIVAKRIRAIRLLKLNIWNIVYIGGVSLFTYTLSKVISVENPTILLPTMAVFGTVIGLFLAFRTNEAYNRWWEARTLWGGMVNDSRSFAREIFAFLNTDNSILNSEELEIERKKFIYRHIGYINSLRLHLRNQRERQADELSKWVDEEEKEHYLQMANIPAQMIFFQSKRLKEVYKESSLNDFEYVQMNSTLNRFYDIQGGCERIKNTVFPRMYSYYTTSMTYVFSFILIFSLVDEFDWQTLAIRALVGYVFIVINQLSADLKNPFENRPSDTPMTALCRTIEIDLRQMLGEKEVPSPIQPVGGVLY